EPEAGDEGRDHPRLQGRREPRDQEREPRDHRGSEDERLTTADPIRQRTRHDRRDQDAGEADHPQQRDHGLRRGDVEVVGEEEELVAGHREVAGEQQEAPEEGPEEIRVGDGVDPERTEERGEGERLDGDPFARVVRVEH
ncbi:hypothetical protein ABE10_01200, partial [Bacillus toyonensis]|nr:hypothetical protein [Bacillus toyonensis]